VEIVWIGNVFALETMKVIFAKLSLQVELGELDMYLLNPSSLPYMG